jgi:hypothetical protein
VPGFANFGEELEAKRLAARPGGLLVSPDRSLLAYRAAIVHFVVTHRPIPPSVLARADEVIE